MVLHVVAVIGRALIRPDSGPLLEVLALLNAGQERSLAAWWTAALLIGAALAAAVVAKLSTQTQTSGRSREALSWTVLTVVFAMLSLDEVVSLHERGASWTAAAIDAGSPLALLGWIIPATAVLVLSLVVLVPVFRALPRRPRTYIIAGLGTSITAALGLEFVNVLLVNAGTELRWRHIVMAAEEAIEMLGVLIILAGTSMALRITYVDGTLTLKYLGREAGGES
ncbi:hypothetical protein SAMN04488563_5431 [Jiangella alkaliphila]|uniref:Uncharacterized protein n=2 Tax=Jiangella alkaliphila TaxID=419479 RepID=A0A1H2L7V6_9ACTN|nr:hypothetical protein SAMN04488563_5431 [Jiangella alkaliphila]